MKYNSHLSASVGVPLASYKFRRLVFTGDNKQLPPTVKLTDKKMVGSLEITLLDRIIKEVHVRSMSSF